MAFQKDMTIPELFY